MNDNKPRFHVLALVPKHQVVIRLILKNYLKVKIGTIMQRMVGVTVTSDISATVKGNIFELLNDYEEIIDRFESNPNAQKGAHLFFLPQEVMNVVVKSFELYHDVYHSDFYAEEQELIDKHYNEILELITTSSKCLYTADEIKKAKEGI